MTTTPTFTSHASNMPPGYSDEGFEPAARGEETAIYEELRAIFDKYRKWLSTNAGEFFNDDDKLAAMKICNDIEGLLCNMEGPL